MRSISQLEAMILQLEEANRALQLELDGRKQGEDGRSRLFEFSLDMLCVADFQGRLLQVNPAWTECLGWSAVELTSRPMIEFILPEDHAATLQIRESIYQGIPVRGFENRYRCKDGSHRWLSWDVYPSMESRQVFAVARDVTQRKQAEEALRESEEKFSTSFQLSPIPMALSTVKEGRYLDVNREFLKLVERSYEEVVGHTALELGIWSSAKERAQKLAGVDRRREVRDLEMEIRGKSGKLTRILWSAVVVIIAGEECLLGSSLDITSLRKLEEQFRQSQKMEAFGQLAGGVAHDFNNILAVIELQAELLKSEGELGVEQRGIAEEIVKASRRAASLTHQLLLFSRQRSMQLKDLDINEVLGNMALLLRRTLGEHIELEIKLPGEKLFIHADPGMVDQILLNFAVNARDAMPGGGSITMEASSVEWDAAGAATGSFRDKSGSYVRLSVTDTGSGIPPEILPRIFEPFFTTKEVGRGTGLGLATIFGVVEQHKGWIDVRSEVGRGTTFHVYLPRQTRPSVKSTVRLGQQVVHGGHETILLVEDDPVVRSSVALVLSRCGYHVLEASNGVEAEKVWEGHRDEIRLLLTDLVMPGGVGGRELAGRLQRYNPRLKVVYTSGYSKEFSEVEGCWEDGSNFLSKPFEAHRLARIVRQNLDELLN